MRKNTIRTIVTGLKEHYMSTDVYCLINSLSITLIKKPLLNGKKAKCVRNIFGDEFIYISSTVSEYEEKFILAHELGHIILHKDITCEYYDNSLLNKDKLEFEANYFAMEFLLPNNLDYLELEGFSLEQLSNMYGIPEKILLIKINELNEVKL
ncbi:MAG: ImmA/IrrE family metallo-endopeptidase [Bacillota bacterium]|nr:ImmA/IrrE family metallo-endopeptidase [Bacillota bacterium]